MGSVFFMLMNTFSLNFIIATVLATLAAFFLSHPWRFRLAALVAVPFFFYTFFYNFNYGIVESCFPIIMSYVGAFFIFGLYLFFTSCESVPVQTYVVRKQLPQIFLLFVLQFIGVLYASIIPWAFDTFPLSNSEAVLFTLFAGVNEGSEEFVVSSVSSKVLLPSIKLFFILLLAQLAFAIALPRMENGFCFFIKRTKYFLNSNKFAISLIQLQKGVTVFFVFYGLILSIVIPGVVLSTPFRALFQVPVDSELYRNHFVHPDSLKLELPSEPKNLIVIMLESMETNFEHYTPEIVKLQNDNTNFPPGGVSVAGTGWTIAGITGKLCGIPLNMPMGVNEYLGKLPTYLPGATCLMEVLKDLNYNQIFVQGSKGSFTQINDFCKSHGDVVLHDLDFYREKGFIPKDYNVFWGYEDRKLYEFAKRDLDSLSSKKNPFALYMFTIDTHQPAGYVDAPCSRDFADVEGKFPKSLRCASKQLYEFVAWAKQQSWYANTVISVMGDHTMAMLSPKANVPSTDSLYWTNFIINSSVETPVRQRPYSSLDMFPTLLEAMGFKLENRSAALGRSLYSDSLTMLELYGRQTLDSLLRERSIQYDVFLLGKKR